MNEPEWENYVQKPKVVKAFLATERMQLQSISGIVTVHPGEYLVDFGNEFKKFNTEHFSRDFTLTKDLKIDEISPTSKLIKEE
jgi:hypothetical protein